jgi:hypothetical protein
VAYVVVEDFKGGVDRRRKRASGVPGTLWTGSNCHITKGGEIEKRKKFVPKYQLYPGHTFGMKGVGPAVYVFGYEDTSTFPVGAIPAGVTYQRLIHPTAASTPIASILDAIAFLGKVYVIVKFADGNIYHYWDGARVTDWDGGVGNPASVATFGIAVGTKLYLAAGPIVYFCDVNDPTNWTTGGAGGAGFFNVTSSGKGSESLVCMAPWGTGIAFFANSYAQTWTVNADPTKNVVLSTVDNTGGISAHGIVNFGNVDTFYFSPSGIRSMRQQNINGQPFATDVGDNIDKLVQGDLSTLSASVLANTQASVNPFDGRVWFWIGERVYVLSSYPTSKIQAWSWYDMAGLLPGNLDVVGRRMYVRSGDTIYVYGGDSGNEYDTTMDDIYYADIDLPYMHAGRIADNKVATAYNVGAEGEWDVFMKSNPNDPDVEDALGTIDFFTYADPAYPMGIETTHFAPRFRSTQPGPAAICNFSFDFTKAK